eukprot:Protomagalhaensia_sp_Gyna_25__4212@NODE_382_length_3645_cov_6_607044_g293_i0_p1_GENE_NODE_382_length_3645_cov_6_607044_g293_i0NODE_382_length_3645_cov_6_607044_g293_i0_p1_ORF_typecomplete_len625_score86_63Lipase_3/PF01764_25/6_8e19DUF2974/PF11187_8/0_00066DUF676/PF05057_14/3_5e02DUF676/PF05057_14/0_033PhnA_Zn_Ribbon/PF08274_12/0_056Chlorophyllase2/PF12740_7/0_098Abhydrolase_3/PF07859_13/0_16Chlorophyllase/PF07224_11/0_26_NODE_382_length_3645_cov_6_607044_g293_i012983172
MMQIHHLQAFAITALVYSKLVAEAATNTPSSGIVHRNALPRTLFESEPPNPMCAYGLVEGVTKTMGAEPGSALNIFRYVRLSNVLVWLGIVPGRVHHPQLNNHYAGIEVPPNKDVNLTEEVSTKTFAGLHDLYSSVRSLANVLKSELFIATADLNGVVNGGHPWEGLVQSYFVESLFKGLIGKATLEGLSISLASPMMNVGSAVCDSVTWSRLGDSDWKTYTCSAITAVGEAVGCADDAGPDCETLLKQTPRSVVSIDANHTCGRMNTVELELDLDQYNPDSTLVTDHEGLITYYLMKTIWAYQVYATHGGLCGLGFPSEYVIPGWHSISEVSLQQPGVRAIRDTESEGIKTALILSNTAHDELLILIRGTSNDYEWNKNLRTQLVPLADGYGHVHAGIFELASALLQEILFVCRRRLDSLNHSTALDTPRHLRVTVSGHSLGGGVANVLGLLLVQENEHRLSNQLDIQVIGLAAPRTMDREAAQTLVNRATVRNWFTELDAVPKLPCATAVGFPRCDSRTAFGAHGEGLDFYVDQLNPITISTEELAKLDERFGASNWGSIGFNLVGGISINAPKLQIPAPLQIAANHICAYACYLSSRFCLSETQLNDHAAWMCDECGWVGL